MCDRFCVCLERIHSLSNTLFGVYNAHCTCSYCMHTVMLRYLGHLWMIKHFHFSFPIWVSFSNLNHDLYHKGCTDTQSCDCGHIIEDSKHFFLICPLYNNPRRDMLNEVQMHSQARITPQLLLNGNHCLNEGESMHIITVVCTFIYESKRFG